MSDITEHLGHHFKKASPVLFTGAGFSCAATNILGNFLPTGTQLKELLWQLCFPGKPVDHTNSLQDLYSMAKGQHEKDLKLLLTQSFTVDSSKLPDWYGVVFSLPWHRIYTLNIDDLAIAAQRRFTLPRYLNPVSATTGKLRALESVSEKRLDYIYINGALEDAPDKVTFSVSQYAERMSRDQPWFTQLVEDILTHPVVFIGTQLDEPPLWQYIQKRLDRGGGDLAELRPKSYLVSRSLPEARQFTLRSHNVTYVSADAEEFTNDVFSHLGNESKIGHFVLSSDSTGTDSETLKEVSELSAPTGEHSDFLFGAEPTWDDIRESRAIVRQCDQDFSVLFTQQRKTDKISGYILVEGTAGTGKSTLMKRMALTLSANESVGWIDRETPLYSRKIIDAMRAPGSPRILFIDDADIYGMELSSILRDVCRGPNLPIVVAAVTSARVDRVINTAILSDLPSAVLIVPNLCDKDIDGLLTVLEREHSLGELLQLTPAQRVRVLRDKCDRQLLVAMIEATSDEEFGLKIAEEYESLDNEAKKIYATVALATANRFELTRHEILISVSGIKNATLNALEMLSRRRLLRKIRGNTYVVRHHVIADELVKQLGKDGVLGEVIVDLVWSLATEADDFFTRISPKRRLIRRLIDHDFLDRTVGYEEAKHYYQELEKVLAPDLNYWLHRGSLELEHRNLILAERYLNNARGINPRDQNTLTEYAYLLLLKALKAPRGPDAINFVQEAENILRTNIAVRGDRDPHSYHVLISNMIQWVRTGVMRPIDGKNILQSLRVTLQDGRRRHPQNPHLATLAQQLEEELRVL